MHDYQKQTDDILSKYGITFGSYLVGSDCPRFCEDARKGVDMDKLNTFPRRTHTSMASIIAARWPPKAGQRSTSTSGIATTTKSTTTSASMVRLATVLRIVDTV